jgi:hypothetical protein
LTTLGARHQAIVFERALERRLNGGEFASIM